MDIQPQQDMSPDDAKAITLTEVLSRKQKEYNDLRTAFEVMYSSIENVLDEPLNEDKTYTPQQVSLIRTTLKEARDNARNFR